MKTKFKLFPLSLLVLFFVVACDVDDDRYRPNNVVSNSFTAMYPNASRIEWEYKLGYVVADFRDNKKEKDAWFDANGTWVLTETDLAVNDLPAVVTQAIAQSIYAAWRIEDATYLERKDLESVYIVELEKGEAEMDLYYSPEGNLLKAVSGDGDHQITPTPANEKIGVAVQAKYVGAKILEIDVTPTVIEVDLMKDNLFFEMILDRAYNWVQTIYDDIRWSAVPEVVKTAFAQGGFAFHIAEDEVEKLVRPSTSGDVTVYRIELDREPTDLILFYTEEGMKLDQ